jgi:hypothetical protein
MNKHFRLSPPRCSCGEADQTAQHLLQECKDRLPDAKDETLADAAEHSGTTLWPNRNASDDSTVHRRDWTQSVTSDRKEEDSYKHQTPC